MTSAGATSRGEAWTWRIPRALFPPLTSIQVRCLLAYAILSAADVVISTYLFFNGSGDFVESNPLLAWATKSLLLFVVVALAAKALGASLLALLASFGNSFGRIFGDVTVLVALITTTTFFVFQFFTLGAATGLLAAGL